MKVIDGGSSGNGFDHDEPGAVVDAAVDAVEADDFEAGQYASLAADFLTAGQGPSLITQASLQEFLWYRLPRKTPHEDWLPTADGAARLLDKLGLTRYAELARSETTRSVLEAWARDDDEGFERFRAEVEGSGLEPPDTELLQWGDLMSPEEAYARDAVADALEAAIVAGEYTPGARGWRAKAVEITRRTLAEQIRPILPTDLRTYRRIDLVLGSRIEQWAAATGDEQHRELRRSIAARFLDGPAAIAPEPPPNDQLAAALAPLTWLLETCRDGVRVTDAGYLDPAVVRAAAERFDWWPFDDQPRSEADLFPLSLLHAIAKRNRWLLRRTRRISTTRPALKLLDDLVALWWAVIGTIGQADEFSAMVGELVALRLLEGPADYIGLIDGPSELGLAVSQVILAQGWRSGGLPLTERQVEREIHVPLREWRLFGFLEETPITREALTARRPMVTLSHIGEQAALALLYTRATAKRELLLG